MDNATCHRFYECDPISVLFIYAIFLKCISSSDSSIQVYTSTCYLILISLYSSTHVMKNKKKAWYEKINIIVIKDKDVVERMNGYYSFKNIKYHP